MPRWPRRPACRPPRSRRSAPAARRFSPPTDEALVHRVCSEIFRTQRLSDASFNEAIAAFGERGLVEIISIIGYYTLIGNTLNVFQVPLPEGVTPPFPEQQVAG